MIRVDSYDYDGCTGSSKKLPPADIAALNKDLIEKKNAEAGKYTQRFVVTGSNRQSWNVETNNAFNSGASIPVLRELASLTDSEFVPLTLADVCNQRALGLYIRTYDKAIAAYGIDFSKETKGFAMQVVNNLSDKEKFDFDSFDFCDKKLNLLFMQLQYFANNYPDEKIEFNFYDDRDEIISALYEFFRTNSSFLLQGFTFNLIRYAKNGKTHTKEHTLIGMAMPDKDYEATTRLMGKMAKAQGQIKPYDLAFITAKTIEAYKANPDSIVPRKPVFSFASNNTQTMFKLSPVNPVLARRRKKKRFATGEAGEAAEVGATKAALAKAPQPITTANDMDSEPDNQSGPLACKGLS